ncbi:Transmembrane protein [Melia azedarach]|uniref:Transmembrane protein n=1 Tax=Melia azedarach TaxID=155640 RepID=A0ACC1XW76_MELAZ|nr:Transmembrane protein [Melia azedarach]
MTTEQKREEDQLASSTPAVGINGIVEQYRKIKEHAETYPYVWASYIVVYGGFALWTTYRWRKLRKTEDRVRALQERLRKLVQPEESASSASSVGKVNSSAEKSSQSADKISKQ